MDKLFKVAITLVCFLNFSGVLLVDTHGLGVGRAVIVNNNRPQPQVQARHVTDEDVSAAQDELANSIVRREIWNAVDVINLNGTFDNAELRECVDVVNNITVGLLLSLYDIRDACCLAIRTGMQEGFQLEVMTFENNIRALKNKLRIDGVACGSAAQALENMLDEAQTRITEAESAGNALHWIGENCQFALDNPAVGDDQRLHSDFLRQIADGIKSRLASRNKSVPGRAPQDGDILWQEVCSIWLKD